MINEQSIVECYHSDINDLDHIYTLKNGEVLSHDSLLEKMRSELFFDIFEEIESYQIVGYGKVFDGTNGVELEDIRNMIELGLLKDDFHIMV
jgi:hypothetical protein